MPSLVTIIISPYLLVYLLAWGAEIHLSTVIAAFWLIHIFNFAILLLYLKNKRWSIGKVDLLIFAVLGLVFFIPGAYLEYPSDPWEHLRRIFRWSELGYISDYPTNSKLKIAYLWGYSILGLLEITDRRLALDIYSAFWQLAFSLQLFRFARALGCSRLLSYLQVFGAILLFGTTVFSIRYYALSSTPLAYILYLEILILTINALGNRSIRYLWPTPILLLGIALNHIQELIFVPLLLLPILLYYIDKSLTGKNKLRFYQGTITTIIIGFIFGYLMVNLYPELYSKMPPGQIGRFGHFRLWSPDVRYYQETIGVFGAVSLTLSLLFFNKNRLLFAATLVPAFSLIFPPTALLYALSIPSPYLTYRILYAIPLSFGLVGGLYYLAHFLARYLAPFKHHTIQFAFVFSLTLLLAIPHDFPFRGKLFFQLYKVPEELSFVAIDETAQWFANNRDQDKLRHCWIITDNITRTVLATHLGMIERYYGGEAMRRARILPTHQFNSLRSILRFSKRRKDNFCGVLVLDKSRATIAPPTIIGKSSMHWGDQIVDQRWLTSDAFVEQSSLLLRYGWTVTEVPPNYLYYEPPAR